MRAPAAPWPAASAVLVCAAIATVLILRRRHRRPAGATSYAAFTPVVLSERHVLTATVRLFVFRVPGRLALPTGKHVQLAFIDGATGKTVQRSYTPTETSVPGRFDVVMKVYAGGAMGTHLDQLRPGSTVLMRAPVGRLAYKPGRFVMGSRVVPCRFVLMIAGGTGITPMVQIIKAVLRNSGQDRTQLLLIFASSTPDDVLLYHDLVALAEANQRQFSLVLTVSRPDDFWGRGAPPCVVHAAGRVSQALVEAHMPAFLGQRPFPEWAVAGYCGPPAFEQCAKGILERMGFSAGGGHGGTVNLFRW